MSSGIDFTTPATPNAAEVNLPHFLPVFHIARKTSRLRASKLQKSMLCTRLIAVSALIAQILCGHLCLFQLWYPAGGLRSFFTRGENVHVKDILLAIEVSEKGTANVALEAYIAEKRRTI
eukprot:TRINITY_DN3178_c3_g1_i2.p1 TRINITY_DN3178_c3_g1~~TRINITY_DN3178_c3_g1_i2.p1  ORF type:complete len:130 (-),score=9.60 TRINITY_DN3178_c3_g1_i2:21-380(-)